MPMHATATESTAPPLPSRRPARRILIGVGVVALFAWPLWHIVQIIITGNVHEVIPGTLYRGAQPSAASLESLIKRQKIRTVLNVRGCCWPDDWYVAEAKV